MPRSWWRWLRGARRPPPSSRTPPSSLPGTASSFQLLRSLGLGHTWYGATIPHSFTNRTGSTVYIDVGCGQRQIDLEMDEGGEDGSGEWVPFYYPVHCLIGSVFDAIEPGELYQDTLGVTGCTSGGSCGPRLTLPAASTRFRIVWEAYSSVDRDQRGDETPGDLVPLEERVSNHFTFEVVEASH